MEIGDATLKGLVLLDVVEGANGGNQNAGAGGGQGGAGAGGTTYGGVPALNDVLQQGQWKRMDRGQSVFSNIVLGIIPAGTEQFFFPCVTMGKMIQYKSLQDLESTLLGQGQILGETPL